MSNILLLKSVPMTIHRYLIKYVVLTIYMQYYTTIYVPSRYLVRIDHTFRLLYFILHACIFQVVVLQVQSTLAQTINNTYNIYAMKYQVHTIDSRYLVCIRVCIEKIYVSTIFTQVSDILYVLYYLVTTCNTYVALHM